MDFSYRLSDFLLFAPRTYYRQFELLNRDLWPAQIAALLAGAAILALVWRRPAWAGRAIALILAAAFAVSGWFYLHGRYATINWAADWMAIGFAMQAGLLIVFGLGLNRLQPAPSRYGPALIIAGLALQPLAAPLLGRPWTQIELFALAPDPTVAMMLGAALAAARPSWLLLALPLLWSLVSFLTLFTMDASEAWLVLALALAAFVAALRRRVRGRPFHAHRAG